MACVFCPSTKPLPLANPPLSLWGVGCVQLYWYYNTYNKDDWMLKSLVLTVWSLDTVHQGMITHTLYTYLITEYANPVMLGVIVPSLIVSFVRFVRENAAV